MGKQIATVAGGRQSALLGLGVYRPERVVTNDEICELIDSNDEWIQSRSGIRNRRFAAEDENVVTMSIEAGRKAIEASGIDPEQIGCVIVATSTYLLLTPPAAAVVADAWAPTGPERSISAVAARLLHRADRGVGPGSRRIRRLRPRRGCREDEHHHRPHRPLDAVHLR